MATIARTRKRTSLTLDPDVLEEAKAIGINVSMAAQAGILAAIREKRAQLLKAEIAEAARATNAYLEKHGLPLRDVSVFPTDRRPNNEPI